MGRSYKYDIDDEVLSDEAYYQLDDAIIWYGEDISDETCEKLISEMLHDASTSFEPWLENSRAGNAIADAIHTAVWEYVDNWLNKNFARYSKED